jgi:hypothetical protein
VVSGRRGWDESAVRSVFRPMYHDDESRGGSRMGAIFCLLTRVEKLTSDPFVHRIKTSYCFPPAGVSFEASISTSSSFADCLTASFVSSNVSIRLRVVRVRPRTKYEPEIPT